MDRQQNSIQQTQDVIQKARYVWAVVGSGGGFIFLVIIVILYALFGDEDSTSASIEPGPTPTQIQNFFNVFKSGPTTSENNALLTYTITTSYPTAETTARITDFIPANTEFVTASDPHTTKKDATGKVTEVTWEVPVSTIVTITLRPLQSDVAIANRATATLSGSNSSVGSQAPNNNPCDGRWPINNPLGNFGNPSCTFSPEKLYAALKQQDPQYVEEWYRIARCESIDYNPNAHNGNAVDAGGAWGLFQMGRGRNGELDHGDVIWEQQITNAILYNKRLLASGRGWRYWDCARQIGLW